MADQYDKYKILLVDDEEDIRDVVRLSLSDMGHEVVVAENGNEAFRIFKEIHPPVVMTDIKMPGLDGIELLQRIKQDDPEAEVVMITGHGDMDLAVKSLQHEAVDFVTKPINVDALEIALKRVHDKISMKKQLKAYTEHLETLIREKSELQDRLSSLGLMIGSISHNIKGMLTSLDGGIFLINSGFEKEDKDLITEGFDIVKLSSGRIKKMVLDILYYAKERELNLESTDIPKFANNVSDLIRPKIKNHRIDLIRDFGEAPQRAEIDADFLRSALINILDNAVDACLEDESKTSHTIIFKIKDSSGDMIMEIKDDGIGMDGDTRGNLFKLFFSSKGGKGTGFGLYISNNIIKQHNGSINVNSAKGKGSVFSIKIPK